jgi:5-(carboxyamino)imidazole ribonucleotide mutase
MAQAASPLVGIVMGSKSDWEHMSAAAEALSEFKVSHEVRILSAHRTPDLTLEYAASAVERGLQVMIAGAGGAAHLPGVIAAKTILPVIGVPVATMAIGKAGAANAGLFAVAILALSREDLAEQLVKWRAARAQEVLQQKLP